MRLAERRDAEAIRAIYNLEVTESTVTFDLVPRTLDEQVEWIDDHSGGHPAVVAVGDGDKVLGFGSLSPYRPAGVQPDGGGLGLRAPRRKGRRRGAGHPRRAGAAGRRPRLPLDDRPHRGRARRIHRAARGVRLETAGAEREVGRKLGRWLDVVLMQRML